MVAIFDHKLGDLGGLASLERYLRGSREHLEGNFCGSKMVAIFDPQT